MATEHQHQNRWEILNWASETVSAGRVGESPRILSSDGSTATDPLTVNIPVLTYGATWAVSAQNPAKWPTSVVKRLENDANGVQLQFLVSDTDNDQATATIWRKSPNGAPFNMAVLNPIQAGTAICDNHKAAMEKYRGSGSLIRVAFDNGSTEIEPGDTIDEQGAGTASATVERVTVTSGAWADADAAGYIYINSPTGQAWTNDDVIDIPDSTKRFYITSGGTAEPKEKDTLIGETSKVSCTIDRMVNISGNWGEGDWVGWLYVSNRSGTFTTSENLLLDGTDVGTRGTLASVAIVDASIQSTFRYADKIVATSDHAGIIYRGTQEGDGIIELRFDVLASTEIFCDFDCDAGTTNGIDAICLMKSL